MKPKEIFVWIAVITLGLRIFFAKYLSFEYMILFQIVIVVSLLIVNIDFIREFKKTKKNEIIMFFFYIILFISLSDLTTALWKKLGGNLAEKITPPFIVFVLFVFAIVVYRQILKLAKKGSKPR